MEGKESQPLWGQRTCLWSYSKLIIELAFNPVCLCSVHCTKLSSVYVDCRNTVIWTTRALEKAVAPHSSTLAWKIPWMEEPGGLQSMGSHRVGHDWSDLAAAAEYWKLEGEMFSVVDKQLSNYFSLIHLFIKQVLCQLPHLVTNSEVQRKLYHDTNQYFIFFFL